MHDEDRMITPNDQVAADDTAVEYIDGIDIFDFRERIDRYSQTAMALTAAIFRNELLEDFLTRVLPEDETLFGVRDAANLLDVPQTHLIALLLRRRVVYRTQGEPGGPANPKGNDRRLRPYGRAIRAGKAKPVMAPDRHAKGGMGFPQTTITAGFLKTLMAEDRTALRVEAAAAADWFATARQDGLSDICETGNDTDFGVFRCGDKADE